MMVRKSGFFLDQLEVALSDALDFGKFLAGAAEPDVDVGILDADFLGEIGHLQAGFSGCLERGEDLLLERSAGSTLGGTSGFCRLDGLSFLSWAAAALSAGANGLAGEQGGKLTLDLLDLGKEAFLAFGEFDQVAQGAGIDVC